MRSCPHCGESNPVRARFCLACGTALGESDGREARKTVTVLFADMVGSTELGDRLDPESIRRVVSRYFDVMRAVVERHGGTVEKFIGDAIMAVFGIPNIHEDDALRALRAANEMRERLRTLNEELDHEWGVRLKVRIGVHTGEVIAGDPARGQAFVSGDTVNVAARLEQAAAPDEILIGERTWRFDEARESHAVGVAMLEDLGQQLRSAEASHTFFNLAMLAGDPAAAEARLRSACDVLERMGASGFLGTGLGMLAEAIYAQGRFADAATVSERAEALTAGDPSDVDAQYRWRAVRAKVLARKGEYAAAEILAREAVALNTDADWLNSRAEVHRDLAEVLQLAGRKHEALAAVDEALHLYEAKENVGGARRARARRDELTTRT